MRSFTILLFSFFLSPAIHAQLFNSFEIKGGLSTCKPTNEGAKGLFLNESLKNRTDAHKGVALEANVFHKISPLLSIGTGIHYFEVNYTHVLGGFRLESDIINGTSTTYRNKVSIANIGVPLLLRLGVRVEKNWLEGLVGVGLYRSFTTISATEVTGGGALDPAFAKLDIEDISNKFNLSAQLGVRALVPVAARHFITIGGKLEYFLSPDIYYYDGAKGNLLGISASVGYMFAN